MPSYYVHLNSREQAVLEGRGIGKDAILGREDLVSFRTTRMVGLRYLKGEYVPIEADEERFNEFEGDKGLVRMFLSMGN